MAIDPDVQVLLDTINSRLDALEASGGGSVDLTTVNNRLDTLEADVSQLQLSEVDDAWLRYHTRLTTQLEPLTDQQRVAFLDNLVP